MGDNNPGQLYSIIINTNALIAIFGGTPLIIPVNPSNEDYFKSLVEILSVSLTKEVQNSDELMDKIDQYLGNIKGKISNVSQVINQLKTILNKEKMSAVRSGDKESLKIINTILSQINIANKYSSYVSKLLIAGETFNDCLKIVVRAAQPLQTYKGFDDAVNLLLTKDGLYPEVRQALNDVLKVTKEGEEAFITNISNSKSDIAQIIVNLASKMFDDNQDKIKKITIGLLGKKNYNYFDEMFKARDFIYDLFSQVVNFDEAIKAIQPLYTLAHIDVNIHKAIFSNKVNITDNEYINCLKLLLLIESKLMYRYSELFNAFQKSLKRNYSAAIEQSNDNSKKCIEAFSQLDALNK